MSKITFLKLLASCFCLSILFSCASSGKSGTKINIIEGDKVLPGWIKNPGKHPDIKDDMGFVGMSRGLWTSERSAISDAEAAAKRDAVKMLWDEQISHSEESNMTSGGKDTAVLTMEGTEKMTEKRLSEGVVRGRRIDYVTQRVEETGPDGETKNGWRCWVLYVVPKKVLDEIGYSPK